MQLDISQTSTFNKLLKRGVMLDSNANKLKVNVSSELERGSIMKVAI